MICFLPLFQNFHGDIEALDWTSYEWLGETLLHKVYHLQVTLSLAPFTGMLIGCVLVLLISLFRKINGLNLLIIVILCLLISRSHIIQYIDSILGISTPVSRLFDRRCSHSRRMYCLLLPFQKIHARPTLCLKKIMHKKMPSVQYTNGI
ncbi:hypothetical protein AB9P05_17075 [Roseivirga sp. BDSF3-8]|uniref:hypothetical protein n=1 Tax=Roseivirga sp. BDSF3-8 TaxID=3241598 RepID=UPI00353225F7